MFFLHFSYVLFTLRTFEKTKQNKLVLIESFFLVYLSIIHNDGRYNNQSTSIQTILVRYIIKRNSLSHKTYLTKTACSASLSSQLDI